MFTSERARLGWYVLIASAITMSILGIIAMLTQRPWLFPSLGPTIAIVFVLPTAAMASPRNVLGGNFIGICAGALALVVFGLYGTPANLNDLSWRRIGALIVALALTLAVMVWLGVPHPPAGATTMIVALGLLTTPADLAVIMLSLVVVIVVAWVINRVHGAQVPMWAPSDGAD